VVALTALFLGNAAPIQRAQAAPIGQVTLPAAEDAYVASLKPDDSNGSKTGLWVGHAPDYGIERTYLCFAVAPPQGTKIVSAWLRLYLGSASSGDPPMTMQVQRIAQVWGEATLTWNDQANWQPVGVEATQVVSTTPGWYEWEVSELLAEWSAASPADSVIGFRLTGDEQEGEHERGFWSKDCVADYCGTLHPQLVLTLAWPHGLYLPLVISSPAMP